MNEVNPFMNDFVKKMLDYNRAFVEHGLYEKYTTTKYPDRKIAILACMDTRMTELLPAALGLKNGDVKLIKNAGGRVMHPYGRVIFSLLVAVYELGVDTGVGFTGSPIWHMLYAFPPISQDDVQAGFDEFARRFRPILDAYQKMGIRFALEAHPTEIAFDIASAKRALEALDYHPAFGFNYDPSHLGYQGVDYVQFIYTFADRIFHVHMKDVWWSDKPMPAGVFGGHLPFGDVDRYWDFRSMGRGKINFEELIRALNRINYQGPLSVEWEDSGMDREHGAAESLRFVKSIDFKPSTIAFDAGFEK